MPSQTICLAIRTAESGLIHTSQPDSPHPRNPYSSQTIGRDYIGSPPSPPPLLKREIVLKTTAAKALYLFLLFYRYLFSAFSINYIYPLKGFF
jgi:hypothetical protein